MADMNLWNPIDEIGEMRRMMSRFFGRPGEMLFPEIPFGRVRELAPAVDIEEHGDEFVVIAELPGVSAKDLELTVHGNMLTIRGEKRYEREEGGEEESVPVEAAGEGEEKAGRAESEKPAKEAKGGKSTGVAKKGEALKARGEQGLSRPMFRERVFGSFERIITLPDDVDAEKIDAKFRDGVLEIHIPRAESAKPRTIQIH